MLRSETSPVRRRALAATLLAAALGAGACAGAPRPIASTRSTVVATAAAEAAPRAEELEAEPEPEEAPPAAPTPRRVTIGASGDILVHLKVIRSAHEHASAGGFEHVFASLRGIIDPREVAFANLETPLSSRVDAETGDPPTLGAPAEVADALGAVGIDVVSVANNHAYDQTAAGMGDTLEALAHAEVHAIGAAMSDEAAPGPVVVERDGTRVALVAFTERVNRSPLPRTEEYARVARAEDEALAAAIARARELADVVVLSIHWSNDFVETPRITQRRRAHELVALGVDLILGHGPHVLQEVERLSSPRGEAVVAYSLGNLVSNQALRYRRGRRVPTNVHPAVVLPATRDGVWLRTTFAIEEGRLRVEGLEGVPLWTHNNFIDCAEGREPLLDIRVRPLREMDEALRAERRPAIEAALGAAVRLVD